MSTTLYMTDTTAVPFANNVNGNGTATLASVTANDLLSFNAGDQGAGNEAYTLAGGTTTAALFFQTAAGALAGWGCAAGTWTVNLDLTGPVAQEQVDSIYVVQLDGSGNLVAVLGSATGGLGAVGTAFSASVTVSAVAAFGANDVLNVIVNLHTGLGSSGTTVNTQSFVTTLQQVQAAGVFYRDDDGYSVEFVDWW